MKMAARFPVLLGFLLMSVRFSVHGADSASNPAGHWEGSIQLPTSALDVLVDLDRGTSGSWSGTIDIPVQGLRGFKLGGTEVKGQAVSFGMPGVPGDPKFSGKLDAAGKTIIGQFTQAGQTFPFKLERKAKTALAGETPSRGVPGKGLAGNWQGTLKPTPVIELRLALEITNAPGGGIGGMMISVDQGGARIPITALNEKGGEVHLETKSVGGVFDGKLNKDGSEISGDWKQGGNALPLVFKRLDKAPSFGRPQDPKRPVP
jgi:hypothetical protein